MPELTEGQLDAYERNPEYFHGRRPIIEGELHWASQNSNPSMGMARTGREDLLDPWGQPLPDPGPFDVAQPVPTAPSAPAGPTYPGGGGGGAGSVAPFAFTIPGYSGPSAPQYNYSPLPQFVAPTFTPPSAEDALNSPGYQFREQQGQKALQQAAAAKGLLRSGGTLKDLSAWSQNFASQEYQNVFDRALQSFDRKYTGARDEYAPKLLGWQTKTAGMQRAADLAFQRAWQAYTFPIQQQQALEMAVLGAGAPNY